MILGLFRAASHFWFTKKFTSGAGRAKFRYPSILIFCSRSKICLESQSVDLSHTFEGINLAPNSLFAREFGIS